jgi:hypothetical protein
MRGQDQLPLAEYLLRQHELERPAEAQSEQDVLATSADDELSAASNRFAANTSTAAN